MRARSLRTGPVAIYDSVARARAHEPLSFQRQVFARGASSRFVGIHELSLDDRLRSFISTTARNAAGNLGTSRAQKKQDDRRGGRERDSGRSLRLCEVGEEGSRLFRERRVPRASTESGRGRSSFPGGRRQHSAEEVMESRLRAAVGSGRRK